MADGRQARWQVVEKVVYMLWRWAQSAFNKEEWVKEGGKTKGARARVGWREQTRWKVKEALCRYRQKCPKV